MDEFDTGEFLAFATSKLRGLKLALAGLAIDDQEREAVTDLLGEVESVLRCAAENEAAKTAVRGSSQFGFVGLLTAGPSEDDEIH